MNDYASSKSPPAAPSMIMDDTPSCYYHDSQGQSINQEGDLAQSNTADADIENNDNTLSDYEKLRARNIERNNDRLISLGLMTGEEARQTKAALPFPVDVKAETVVTKGNGKPSNAKDLKQLTAKKKVSHDFTKRKARPRKAKSPKEERDRIWV